MPTCKPLERITDRMKTLTSIWKKTRTRKEWLCRKLKWNFPGRLQMNSDEDSIHLPKMVLTAPCNPFSVSSCSLSSAPSCNSSVCRNVFRRVLPFECFFLFLFFPLFLFSCSSASISFGISNFLCHFYSHSSLLSSCLYGRLQTVLFLSDPWSFLWLVSSFSSFRFFYLPF